MTNSAGIGDYKEDIQGLGDSLDDIASDLAPLCQGPDEDRKSRYNIVGDDDLGMAIQRQEVISKGEKNVHGHKIRHNPCDKKEVSRCC
jgi:hypothetical protein